MKAPPRTRCVAYYLFQASQSFTPMYLLSQDRAPACCAARVKSPKDEFEELFRRRHEEATSALRDLVSVVARGGDASVAEGRFGAVMSSSMAMADLLGRRRVLLERDAAADRVPRELRDRVIFEAGTPQDVVPNVPFRDAVRDLVDREPRLAGTAEEVAELYQSTHAFALAFSTRESVTRRVQAILEAAVQEGIEAPSAIEMIRRVDENFTRWYADTVYRTNLNTAYTAGRFAQARDPDVAQIVGAMERFSIMDSSVRSGRDQDHGENHAAAHGLIAPVDDPIWNFASPPSGYGCRCGVLMVSRFELEAKGLLSKSGQVTPFFPTSFSKFRPHENFRVSAHKRIYG